MKAGSRIYRALTFAAMCAVAGTALAQAPAMGRGPGQGYGPSEGMGPGMMQGHPGMMQGHQGMMQGHEGMMQGREGMMRGRGERIAKALGLNPDQRAKARQIMEDTRRKNWDVIGQIQSERFKLREMLRADKVDPNAAVEQKRKVDDLKRQVMKARLEARNEMFALLTPEQREKARSMGLDRMGGGGRGHG